LPDWRVGPTESQGQFARGLDVRPGEHPIARDVGVEKGAHTESDHPLGKIHRRQFGLRCFLPAARGDNSITGVNGHKYALAVLANNLCKKCRLFNSQSSQNNVIDSFGQGAPNRFGSSQAAAQFDFAADGLSDGANGGEVFGSAAESAIEVYHMDAPRAGGVEPAGDCGRIVAEFRAIVGAALPQANAAARH
jgi:hypothetical protein